MSGLKWGIFVFVICFLYTKWVAADENTPLLTAAIDPKSLSSLQRGAKMYINYCSGCHSLNFMRYNKLAEGLGIFDKNGQVNLNLVKKSFIFTGANIADTLHTAMRAEDAKVWFGVAPPDLSVIARARGVNWLYTYLLTFYQDNSKPFGVNNLVYKETAMPDVLVNLRGTQIPVYHTTMVTVDKQSQVIRSIDYLMLTSPGLMSTEQFKESVTDLVNFLAYVAEPSKQEREKLGVWVLGFLIIFAVLAFLLKKEYWKNIK